jgi:primosomal protein N'
MYAKVVVGLAVEGPFDYQVPAAFEKKIKKGMRVLVAFGFKKMVAVVVALSRHSSITKVKPLISLLVLLLFVGPGYSDGIAGEAAAGPYPCWFAAIRCSNRPAALRPATESAAA